MKVDPKLIAFYLTQFHPTPENDDWWGRGFTEWTNVTKARPLFDSHYQPHLPTDLGFYDLRVKQTRLDQIEMAKKYGVQGFCYHYYWFSGKRILNEPLDAMLADRAHDMPFCLNWANENWTRRWDAAEHEVLIAQKYLPDDDLNFIKSLVPFFMDPRYIRVDGKPFFMVYRPQHLPNPKKTLNTWREYCRFIGLGEIYLTAALTHGNLDYEQHGFDGGVEFPPHNLRSGNKNDEVVFYETFVGNAMQYSEIAQSYVDRRYGEKCNNVFKTVFPSWDNTARTGNRALVTLNGTPRNYEHWLNETVRLAQENYPDQERLVFINAWNEWAEGCHLEPDRVFGKQFLEATLRVKNGVSDVIRFEDLALPTTKTVLLEKETAARSLRGDIGQSFQHHRSIKIQQIKNYVRQRPLLSALVKPFWNLFKTVFSSNKP